MLLQETYEPKPGATLAEFLTGKPVARRVISHWNKLFDGFSMNAGEFYLAVTEAVERRKIPGVVIARVEWHQGGIFSARREYLRILREKLAIDICAAPFGSGCFFSWWLAEVGPSYFSLILVPVALIVLPFVATPLIGMIMPVRAAFGLGSMIGGACSLAILAFIVTNWRDYVDMLSGLPYIGPVFEAIFRPITYYKVDTTTMYQSMVHAAVLEVIEGLTTAKGQRPLTEAERKPIMREFFAK